MPSNLGPRDRPLRIIIGVSLLSLPFLFDSPLRWLGLIGLVPLLAGLAGRCLACRLMGLDSCPSHQCD